MEGMGNMKKVVTWMIDPETPTPVSKNRNNLKDEITQEIIREKLPRLEKTHKSSD